MWRSRTGSSRRATSSAVRRGPRAPSSRSATTNDAPGHGRASGASMSYETILYSVEAGVARITLNRPDKLNSFNGQMHAEVRAALARLATDGARTLVLTGAGRGFCAGQDLGDRAVAPGEKGADLGASIEDNYKPLV